MKQAGTSVLVALALICVVSCAKIDDESSAVAPEQPARPTVLLPTRSYEEALSLARKSIALVDRGQTRSATARSIRSERGQCVTTPSTRSGAGSDTLMYVFNFENNDGFSVIAANRAVDPVLAVAESRSCAGCRRKGKLHLRRTDRRGEFRFLYGRHGAKSGRDKAAEVRHDTHYA